MRDWTENGLRTVLKDPRTVMRGRAACETDGKNPDTAQKLVYWGAKMGWQGRICDRGRVVVFTLVSSGRSLLRPPAGRFRMKKNVRKGDFLK